MYEIPELTEKELEQLREYFRLDEEQSRDDWARLEAAEPEMVFDDEYVESHYSYCIKSFFWRVQFRKLKKEIRDAPLSAFAACIGYDPEHKKFKLVLNREFFQRCLSHPELHDWALWVIRHEVMHVLLGHVFKDQPTEGVYRFMQNMAMDLAVNSLIAQGAPGFSLLPEKGGLRDFPANLSMSEYYRLLTDKFQTDKVFRAYILLQYKPDDDLSASRNSVEGDDDENNNDSSSRSLEKHAFFQMDENGSPVISEMEIAGIHREMQQILEMTGPPAEICSAQNIFCHEILKGFLEVPKSANRLVAMLIQKAHKTGQERTFASRHRRFDWMPGTREKLNPGKVHVLMDASGSVSDPEFHEFFVILKHINQFFPLVVCDFACEPDVDGIRRFGIHGLTPDLFIRKISGSTDFTKAIKFMRTLTKKDDHIIMLTDLGDTSSPITPEELIRKNFSFVCSRKNFEMCNTDHFKKYCFVLTEEVDHDSTSSTDFSLDEFLSRF